MTVTWFWGLGATALLLIYYLLYKFSKYQQTYWPSRGFTLIGTETTGNGLSNLINKKLLFEIDELIYNKAKSLNKPFVGIMESSKPVLFVNDLNLLRSIFVKDFDYFMNRRKLFDSEKDQHELLAKNLFMMEGEPWKSLRSKLTPTFTTGKIRRMFDFFEESSKKCVKYLEQVLENSPNDDGDGEVDLVDPLGRLTMDAIASAAFGLDAKMFEEDKPIFQEMGKRNSATFDLSLKLVFVFMARIFAPSIASALKLGITDKVSAKFFTDVILRTIRHRESTGEKRNDFLQLMLEARDGQLKADDDNELSTFEKEAKITESKYKVTLTDDIIIAQSVGILSGGADTAKNVLLFLAYELALNPDIQEKLYEEVEAALNDSDEMFTYDNVNNMEYLDKVVHETLRKYPTVPKLERRAAADYKIPGTELVIPKNTIIAIPTYCIHHDPEIYPNPTKFDPERFSQESKGKRNPYAFQPFGHGPRNCIGMRFTFAIIKIAIANLIHKFKIEPSKKTVIPIEFAKNATLKPNGEKLFFKLQPRA